MKKIIIPKPKNDSLVSQLVSLYNTFKGTSGKESLEFDLCQLKWVCPLLILPVSAYINSTDSKSNFNDCPIKDYLNIISFPDGVDSITSFEKSIQAEKSWIPISRLQRDLCIERERLESMFVSMVYKVIDISISGVRSGIYYPISELVTNIFEHSKQKTGFIFGQFYPKKNYLDICIVDRGRGLSASYKQEKNLNFSDEKAITEVMSGTSVKPDRERGYGVWTSKRVICDGLEGNFILLSGSAALISSKDNDKIVELPDFYWQGVIVGYRMPKPQKPFDISKYVE